jgi:outer membrane protein TolC
MSKLIFIPFFVLFFSISFGQKTLSVREAIFTALENNYKIQIAEKQEEIAKKNNTWSEAGLFPTVSLNATFSNQVQDNTKNPFTFTPGLILFQSLNPSLSANWNIFAGFAVKINKERLELLENQSKGNALVLIENTTQDVIKAYFTAVLQKNRRELFKTLLDFSAKKLNYFELKDKYAKSNSLELFQLKNQFLTDSSSYLLQDISYKNALRNLNTLMNVPENEQNIEYILSDSLSYTFPIVDFNQAKSEMLNSNQNILNQYISIELQKSAIELQKSFLYPTLSFQTGVTPNFNWLRDLNNENLKINTQVLSYYGNINLRYTIFNNWKSQRAVEVAKIQTEISELNKLSLEQSLSNTLENLIDLFKLRSKLLEISEENIIYAKKMIDLADSRFQLGTINSIELFSIQNNYQNTLIQYYENQFNRLDTYLEIYKLMGKLGLEYQK